jgi:hypothetical protein
MKHFSDHFGLAKRLIKYNGNSSEIKIAAGELSPNKTQ